MMDPAAVQLAKEIAIPIVAFILGAILLPHEKTAIPGKLAMFFGAQTLMNLYMKEVLSGTVISEEDGLRGIPSAFLVTALQQLVAFLLFGAWILISRVTPWPYSPKRLSTPMEWMAVVLFSFSFTMNIALNNYSISLLPLSVNLIIRSCLPIATFVTQRVASQCTGEAVKDASAIEVILMLLGVACAAVAVVAKSHSVKKDGSSSHTLLLGILICVASLFSGAVNLALAGVLGTSVKLNALDTVVYMAVPAFLFLVFPSLLYFHDVSEHWPDYDEPMTDFQVLLVVGKQKPMAISLVFLSGVLALFYNVFQYSIVQTLSASYTAFAGNFNKAATIALGLLVGLETLPPGLWGLVMVLACLGNIVAFTAFSLVKIQDKNEETRAEALRRGFDEEPLTNEEPDKTKEEPASFAQLFCCGAVTPRHKSNMQSMGPEAGDAKENGA